MKAVEIFAVFIDQQVSKHTRPRGVVVFLKAGGTPAVAVQQ